MIKFGRLEKDLTRVNICFQEEDYGVSKELYDYISKKDIFKAEYKQIFQNLGPKSENIILLGLGKREDFNFNKLREVAYRIFNIIKENKISSLKICGGLCKTGVQAFAEGLLQADYTFDVYKKEKTEKFDLSVDFEVDLSKEELEEALKEIENLMEGVFLTKDLVNTPSIDMYPEVLAQKAKEYLQDLGVEVEILDKKAIEKLGMQAFLAVSKGSAREPRFIIMKYLPVKGEKPLALVGKGLTYDSGGYALKIPATNMVDMKSDMAGSASVIGSIYALAKNKVKKNVVGLVATCENMISGEAYKNGDIISSMKGLHIEVINTDAEGRLTLADALYYAATKVDSKAIIDMATLTGACIMALGMRTTGSVTNDEKLYEEVAKAFEKSGEQVWQLPIFEDSEEKVKSDIADLKNSTTGGAGTITAGIFLKNFVEGKPWVHLDIAGPAFSDSAYSFTGKGATGIPVKSIYNFVKEY
ncbi:cytosol aminopeptidase family, catalytic domain protein [Clostridiales bacterium KA00134]|nr:cytosol aminopeptidase family, catalytic domain protein [Clostridiales bacterium KA00134]